MAPNRYRLVIEGELDDRLAGAFKGMVLERQTGTTVLTGSVRDQADLQGLLQRVAGLGLTLLSANAVEDTSDRRPDGLADSSTGDPNDARSSLQGHS